MFALKINRRASVTPHITFLVHTVVIQLLVLGIERHNRLGWSPLDCGIHQRPLNTQHCIYMSLHAETHYDCEIVHSMHIHSFYGASGLEEITGEVADRCKTRVSE